MYLASLCVSATVFTRLSAFLGLFKSENSMGGVEVGCLSLAECFSTFLLIGQQLRALSLFTKPTAKIFIPSYSHRSWTE